ncbi:pilus assembly protein TadG-related protein [Massilia horti]|uniref:Pilus assembly protein TadE n=1 Tax=Massilia horti TaxID=2562153 RepID=A0A4Y9STV7_9BURK|nr:pilus assembly protein TadG-related protein [Massilia horti]TFW29878.1 pilus assembly protein TadE [Massilia horti]
MDSTTVEAARDAACLANYLPNRSGETRQRGAVAVMFAVLLPLIIVCYGLALDLGRVYSRKAEMQAIAGSAAIAAAKKLNGTKAGIENAITAAGHVLQGGGDNTDAIYWPKYGYVNTMVWSDAAIMFSKTADGSTGWLSAESAKQAPRGLAFVKVDTSALDKSYGAVDMLFAPVSSSFATVNVSHTAVAGRGSINVTPFGICAMDAAFTRRKNVLTDTTYDELVEYGFRRGVGYNLMKLNPNGSVAGRNYLIDPVALSGSGSPNNLSLTTVTPYVCTGTMAVPRLIGEKVTVQSGFPLASLVNQLNSRLDIYTNGCDAATTPPGTNVKQYTANSSLGWMSPKPPTTSQTAASQTITRDGVTMLQTKADQDPPNNLTTTDTGVLWAYAKAVPWSAYTPGVPEPEGGYEPFETKQVTWDKLYGSSVLLAPTGSNYPSPTPSASITSPPALARRPGVANRRVLNVPILDCATMSGSTATVLAVGRFFMTVQATTSAISAEFAGATSEVQAGGPVELVQ